jgi:hypothetical protein
MAFYPELPRFVGGVQVSTSGQALADRVVPYLVGVWLDDYGRTTRSSEIVETRSGEFSYLFDIEHERLIAAWGISQGRNGEARDKARMAGHPLSNGPHYHRGHAIPHSLGGPTDINLVPQLGSVNVGPFRALEREAVKTPGALYFTYWLYPRSNSQTPIAVEQGLLSPGAPPTIRRHAN